MQIVQQMIVNLEIEHAIQQKLIYSSSGLLANDWDEAFTDWLPLAEEGNPKAQFNIGYCYAYAKGTDFDLQKAIDWYTKAAAQNTPRACRNLGLLYRHQDFVLKPPYCEFVPREFIAFNVDIEKSDQYLAQGVSFGDEVSIFARDTILLAPGMEEFAIGNRNGARAIFQQLFDQGHECGRLGLIACDIAIDTGSFRQLFAPTASDLNNKFQMEFIVRNQSIWEANVKFYLFIHDAEKMYLNTASSKEKIPAKGIQKFTTRHFNELSIVTFTDLIIKYEDSFFRDFSANLYFKLNGNPASPSTFKVNKGGATGCFVVTACTGSTDNNTVEQFRQFRDNTLSKYSAGRSFISWYYCKGPLMAEWISTKPRLLKLCGRIFDWMAKLL
jgi:hypothetical protein